MKKWLIAGVAALVLAGCGGGGDDSKANITGNWTGTSTYTLNGTTKTDTITASITHTGYDVKGSLKSSSGLNAVFVDAHYAGVVDSSFIYGNIQPYDATQCPYKFTGVYKDNKITGTATTYNCTISLELKISIAR